MVFCRTLLKIDLRTDKVQFTQPKGWFHHGSKAETVGMWKAIRNDVSGFEYITLHRTDTTKQKNHPRQPRDEGPAMDYDEYFDGEIPPGKGRGLLYKSEKFREKHREFKGSVWFAKDFPLTVQQVLPIIELLAPSGKHFEKLQTFVNMKLPNIGFPVKIGKFKPTY
jgi:hypothetical protein